MRTSGVDDKVIGNIFQKFLKVWPRWDLFIDQSFLPADMQEQFKAEIRQKLAVLAG